MLENNRYRELKKIRDEIFNLKKSPLYGYRTENKFFPVIGEGDHLSKIMLIGEAPGKNEALSGRPFCGAAGKVLDELLASVRIPRKDVYITNIVKDRPPMNRDPLPEEIKIYGPFLDRQINIIKPKVIATLGRYAMGYVMNKFGLFSQLKTIGVLHGKIFKADIDYGEINIVPLYHPAVAVYDSRNKDVLKKDFQVLRNL